MDVKPGPAVEDRAYPAQPRVGVGAVIFDPMHRVLLVQRRNPPAEGQWGLPGGVVELGETLQQALQREIAEECGIEVDVVDLIGVYEPIVRDAQDAVLFHYVVVDYLCRWTAGQLTPGGDAQAVAWASPRNMDRYALAQTATEMIAAARRKTGRPAPT